MSVTTISRSPQQRHECFVEAERIVAALQAVTRRDGVVRVAETLRPDLIRAKWALEKSQAMEKGLNESAAECCANKKVVDAFIREVLVSHKYFGYEYTRRLLGIVVLNLAGQNGNKETGAKPSSILIEFRTWLNQKVVWEAKFDEVMPDVGTIILECTRIAERIIASIYETSRK
ncbi:MAG: hypothetical protein HYT69_01425 [Candidatus Zambryskibacteria bacterium]|nr:hypothetical protein [Candidatus Zambryskibacteria bacterium]